MSSFDNGRVRLTFAAEPTGRRLSVVWPGFEGQSLSADLMLALPPEHESLTIVIPIPGKRFYYNRKVNCMPAEGWVEYQGRRYEVHAMEILGNLDWGRGVWEYRSFWVWASASARLPGGRTLGLNLGFGFGDASAATENTIILDGRIHKLGQVRIDYNPADFMRPWRMASLDGRLELEFVPFYERTAWTHLFVIASEVRQMFGHYQGQVITNDGEVIPVQDVIGFVEEHHVRW